MVDISTSITEIGYFSKDWEVSSAKDQKDLVQIIKTRAYSNAIFKDAKRSIKNITGFHNYLILDIDNDDTDFSINECEDLFSKNKIASLIIPSRSHRKEKNGVIKDRYRVICCFDKVIPTDISKEVYKTMMGLIVKDLQMADYIDKKALNDMSRYYYPSRNLDESLIRETTGKKIILNDYLKKATLQNNKIGLLKQMALMRKRSKIAEKQRKRKINGKAISIKNHILKKQTIQPLTSSGKHFIYDGIYTYDLQEIVKNIDFLDVVEDYEKVIFEEQNSEGVKIKTEDKNTYQFFDSSSVLYDFKNDISFNIYSYIKNFFDCTSKEVLQHMNQYTNIDSFKSVNEDWQDAVIKSLDISINYKEFQANLIELMDFNKITIKRNEEDFIIIAGKKVHISEFELQEFQNKGDIIKKFQENRKKIKSKKK